MSRPPPASALVRLSISATDEQWALAGERAKGQGKSVSRYLVDAALAEGRTNGSERSLLEAVRRQRALLAESDGRGPSHSRMRERLAVAFAAWAGGLAASGRSAELCGALAPAVGEAAAKRVAAALAPAGAKKSGTVKSGPEPPSQGRLF